MSCPIYTWVCSRARAPTHTRPEQQAASTILWLSLSAFSARHSTALHVICTTTDNRSALNPHPCQHWNPCFAGGKQGQLISQWFETSDSVLRYAPGGRITGRESYGGGAEVRTRRVSYADAGTCVRSHLSNLLFLLLLLCRRRCC